MKYVADEFKKAVWAVVMLSILLCGVYPLAVWSIGQLFFSQKANGSLLQREGTIIGSALIGQPFTSPAYFHSRPSAVAYPGSGAMSGGSNLGPLSKALSEQATTRITNYRKENGLPASFPVPADAFSASASGLDPHISPANALAQAARVANARYKSKDQIMQMIRLATEDKQFWIFGEKRVNVLTLNLALDKQK
ncbi:MAG: K(+)-transporting ATPase subunit C [Candidatus Aminicenantes bacterium]|nr:K(+)-transporting ATPase subunit C [Candidatus Aminicenantes bacterium]